MSAENFEPEGPGFAEYPLPYEGFLRFGKETVILVVKKMPHPGSGDFHAHVCKYDSVYRVDTYVSLQ